MSDTQTTPVFVDTSVLYARIDESDGNHEKARALFDSIRAGDRRYRPLYVTDHVLGELHRLALYNLGPEPARETLDRIMDSALFVILHPDSAAFNTATEHLSKYDDQRITVVDHLTATLARERGVDVVAAFDSDFRTLGFDLIPDTGQVE